MPTEKNVPQHTPIAVRAAADVRYQKRWRSGLLRLAGILAALVLLAAAEYCLMSWTVLSFRPKGTAASSEKKDFILSIQGLETTRISGNHRIRLKVGSVMIAPRKFFVFSIQPLNEALIEDFSVDFFRQSNTQGMFQLNDLQQTLLPSNSNGIGFSGLFNADTGLITRGLVRRFKLTIHDGDAIRTVVASARAELDFKNNKIRLQDANIEQHDVKRIIKSAEAVVKINDGILTIPGTYSIFHPEGVLKGNGVKIRL
jgi:hypothetical protein